MTTALTKQNKVALWYTRCPCPTAFSVAWQSGSLKREFERSPEIEFLSLQQSGDPKALASHFSHTQPNSFRFGGNIPAIWARSRGADTRLVGLAWVKTPHPILALPGSGIARVSDLKNRRLLVPRLRDDSAVDFPQATALRTYEAALATAGLTLKDVELVWGDIERPIVDLKAAAASTIQSLGNATSRHSWHRQALFSLIRGEVDAVTFQGTTATELTALLGAAVIYDVGLDEPDPVLRSNNGGPEALTISGKLIEEHPDLVARVVARLLEAGEWAHTHPEDAVRFVAREQYIAEELVTLTYGPTLERVFRTDLAPEKIAGLRAQKDFLLRHGFIQDFDFDAWIDHRPLEWATERLNRTRGATV
jgi:ABC-type nitrate/sulfonate/bicarbonate transport system substrate-binding protein